MEKLYEGKFFYEIERTENPACIKLHGPLNYIRYVAENIRTPKFAFVEMMNGEIAGVFAEDEILVLERKL